MEVNVDDRRLAGDGAVSEMIAFLRDNEANLGLARAQLYYDFPVLKDADGRVVVAKVLLLSQSHGVVAMATTDTASADRAEEELRDTDQELDHVFSLIYSRLIRNRQLRRSKTELLIPASTLIFAPNLDSSVRSIELESPIALSTEQLGSILNGVRRAPVSDSDFAELVATIEGAKGIIRPHPRDVSALSPRSKGVLANKIESEITSFDRRQKHGAMPVLDGLQRVRGLAGSGKTVVLAMKAALTHLREPEASIVYTFYTKSLYQHIQRLITRFYRQFEDRDPDWSRLRILHGWGGFSGEGVYFNACQANRVSPLTLSEARVERARDPFDYACKKLLDATEIKPMYDFVLVDEGQDFPASFVRLCTRLAEKNRVILAYDDLQTIFQTSTPRLEDIVGTGPDGRPSIGFTEDVILYKCYRNPREILVCAHALGLGLYGNIVQMLENREQWEDIGYRVLEGDFVEGSPTNIERPEENSLPTISMQQRPSEIVSAVAFRSYDEEVDSTVNAIQDNLRDGLRPDDILVIVVDDRYAKGYLRAIGVKLAGVGIASNNLHSDVYGIRDFFREAEVTLSTVHKAKGNEAFMVYVVGADALYTTYAGVRERNVLFTAMTRAKGWVRVSGVGESDAPWKVEIDTALDHFPHLRFKYPSQEQLKIIKRDLAERAVRKQKAERKLDEVLGEMSPEEVKRFLDQRAIKKGR